MRFLTYVKIVRCVETGDFVRIWQEGVRIFGVDTIFYRMVANVNFFLFDRQRLIGSDTQLFFDQVNVGDYFCNRVFYLNTGVYFDEIEFVVFEQEFESICIAIVDINIRFSVTFVDVATQFRGNVRCWRFFDYFLVAALYGVVTFRQIDSVVLIVSQYLNFDVARIFQVFFYVNYIVVESSFRFRTGYGDGLCQFSVVAYYAYIAIVVVVGGFDNYRIINAFSNGTVFIYIVVQRVVRIRYVRDVRFFYRRDCGYFVVYQANGFCFRVNEDKVGAFNLFGKVGVFGEEVVIRMDCYCVGDFSGVDDCRDVQIIFY